MDTAISSEGCRSRPQMRVMPALLILAGQACLCMQARAGCTFLPIANGQQIDCAADIPPDRVTAPVAVSSGDNLFNVASGAYDGGLVGGSGNDRFLLRGGTLLSVTDTGGDNVLSLPSGSTVVVRQGVVFGAGRDSVEIHDGVINGVLQQGGGEDSFVMTGGTLDTLRQGDQVDTFNMSGGHIVGAFEDGDIAQMSGGRIGRVDLRLSDNRFDMSGGVIDGNLVAGLQNDTIVMSGGYIGGNISVSGGRDTLALSGGEVIGEVRMGPGDDAVTWRGGGIVHGAIDLAAGDDALVMDRLDLATTNTPALFDGGVGNDALRLTDTTLAGIARVAGWESVEAGAGSRLVLDGNLVLGDAGSGGGGLDLQSGSILQVGSGGGVVAIMPYLATAQARVDNTGTIDLTVGGPTDTLAITGNYTGHDGLLRLQTQLEGDGSPSDRLLMNGGVADGRTALDIVNAGGVGGLTLGDGILVVQAAGGATTTPAAFGLRDVVAAGAYEYLLFRGGAGNAEAENWYLRSSLVGVPVPPIPPTVPPTVPPTIPPTVPPNAPTEEAVVPIYRPETPLYAALVPAAAQAQLALLDGFHQRQGEQSLLRNRGGMSALWVRVIGQDVRRQWAGDAAQGIDGSLYGVQAGMDLLALDTAAGGSEHLGVLLGHLRMQGDVDGLALATRDLPVGQLRLEGDHMGAYWTRLSPTDAYLDATVMATHWNGSERSVRADGFTVSGRSLAVSLEAGKPVPLAGAWALEPQAQLVWQRLSFDPRADRYAQERFSTTQAFSGRIGLRLRGDYPAGAGRWQPYARVDLWHDFDRASHVYMNEDAITTRLQSIAVHVGAGLAAWFGPRLAAYVELGAVRGTDGDSHRLLEGNLGMRWGW